MKRRTIMRFEGGPRAGLVQTKTRPARLSTYLNDDGDTVRAPIGDRIISSRIPGSVYVNERQEADEDGNRVFVYTYRSSNLSE